MPYRKRNYKRRSGGFHTKYNKAIYSIGKTATLAKQVYKLKRMINVEYKFIGIINTATAIPVVPVIIQLNNISQGDTSQTREGDQIKSTRLSVHYLFTQHATATQTMVRVMLIKDSQPNGAIYGATDILSDVTVLDSMNSFYNLDGKFRFRILYDRVHTMSDSGNQIVKGKINVNLNDKIRYTGNAGDITDLTNCGYSLMIMSTETTNTPSFSQFTRLRFIDN